MKRSLRLPRRIVRPFLPLLLLASQLDAQPISPQDPYYKLPPAAVGHNSSYLVAQDHRDLYRVDLSSGTIPTLGDRVSVPEEITAIWSLAAPSPTDPSRIIGLASHNEGGIERYCIIRSPDFGATWEVLTSDALRDPAFPVSGDYWRARLRGMKWLEDGIHGWIWGSGGLLATSNGGQTWDIVYRLPDDGDGNLQNDERLNAIGFRNATTGIAALGTYYTQKLYQTTDGGRTWNYVFLSFGQNKVVQIDWVGNEWRVLSADPFKPLDQSPNTSMHFSATGQQWSLRTPPIPTHQTEMSRICWWGEKEGILLMRSGEVWKTSDGGRVWEQVRSQDPSYPIEFAYFPGTKGFGASAIFEMNGNDIRIFEVSTVRPDGEIYRLNQWSVQSVASSPSVSATLAASIGMKAYPNPARVSAEVVFQLKRPARIRLSLIDVRGEEAQQIDAGLMGSGEQRLMLDLNGLPNGSYRYILEIDNDRAAGELIVTR